MIDHAASLVGVPSGVAVQLDSPDVLALLEEYAALRKALTHLLDDADRASTGFPQHIEIRFAVRDGARAALARAGGK